MITLKIILDRTYSAPKTDIGYNFQAICKEVAKAIELELNFRNWVTKSRASARALAKAEGLTKVPKSKADWLLETEGAKNPTQMWRWKKAFEDLQAYRWDDLELHYCGEALVRSVVEALPEHFEINRTERRNKSENCIRMTDDFRKTFDDMEHRIANMQVVKKPMLTQPRPWRKEE